LAHRLDCDRHWTPARAQRPWCKASAGEIARLRGRRRTSHWKRDYLRSRRGAERIEKKRRTEVRLKLQGSQTAGPPPQTRTAIEPLPASDRRNDHNLA
jgi:hypothetical protein